MIQKFGSLHIILFLATLFASFIAPSSPQAEIKLTRGNQPVMYPLTLGKQPSTLDNGAAWQAPIAITAPITVTAAYTITNLGTLGGATSSAMGINDIGQVVGYSDTAGGEVHAFLWYTGIITDFISSQSYSSSALDINDSGQIAGSFITANGEVHAFKWVIGVLSDLGTLGGDQSQGYAINATGQVVGMALDSDNYQRPFLWQNGSMTDLGDLGGGSVRTAYDINKFVQIVGQSSPPFIWQNGVMTGLGAVGSAFGINNTGQVVGGTCHPYLWKNGVIIDLYSGFGCGQANDINDAGYVVGKHQIQNAGNRAFVWKDNNGNGQSDSGEIRNLNDLIPPNTGWTLFEANAINNAGQIVGWGLHNGQRRAFILTPDNAWTLMFYIAGDNDLAGSYPPIFEHLETAANTPGVNLIALWDNLPDGDSAYFEIQYDTDLSKKYAYEDDVNRWPLNEADMSDPATLSNFISWAMTNFPARHYALILDDHGTGLGGGLCETDGTDDCASLMSLAQMKQALADAHTLTGKKIDVLYMAMCLMGMIEDAYQFRNYIDYYVASENLQSTYDEYLPGLDADMTPFMMAELFASNYAAERVGNDHTISVGEIAHLPALVTAVDQLAEAMLVHMDAITPTLATIAMNVQRYDNAGEDIIDTYDTYVDLYDLSILIAQELSAYPDIASASQVVMTAVEAYIVYEAHGSDSDYYLDDSHGVSIFFPENLSSFYYAENNDFAAGTDWGSNPLLLRAEDTISWGQMLVEYIARANPTAPDDPTPPEPRPKITDVSSVFLPMVTR